MPIVQVGLVDWDLAKNYGAEIALKADVKETLRALIPALKSAGGAALEARAKQGIAALELEELDARGAPAWSSRFPGPRIARRSIRTGWRCRWSRRCRTTPFWSTRG